jgi:hypothetical protein
MELLPTDSEPVALSLATARNNILVERFDLRQWGTLLSRFFRRGVVSAIRWIAILQFLE